MNFQVHSIIFHNASSHTCAFECPLYLLLKDRCCIGCANRVYIAVYVCEGLLAAGMIIAAAAHGRSVSVAVSVCPQWTQVNCHDMSQTCCLTTLWKIMQCHRCVALRCVAL